MVVPLPGARFLVGVGHIGPILQAKLADALLLLEELDGELPHPHHQPLVPQRPHAFALLPTPSRLKRRAHAEQAIGVSWVLRPWPRHLLVEDAAVLREANVAVCKRGDNNNLVSVDVEQRDRRKHLPASRCARHS